MSDTPDIEVLTSELEDRVYTSVAYILQSLAKTYLEKIGDTLIVNDALLNTVAGIVGEMIGCYPEDEQLAVYEAVSCTIDYAQANMMAELAELDNSKEGTPEAAQGYDLAKMKPQGNC